MEDLQDEFHSYVKNFFSNLSNYTNSSDLIENFFQNLYPLWDDLYFLTYNETFDGIEDVQKETDIIILSSPDEDIVFAPRGILCNTSDKEKIDVVAITTNGAMMNLEEKILGINIPILVCPRFSQYVDEIERNYLMLSLLTYEVGLIYAENMTEQIKNKKLKKKFKDNLQYMAEINKINSKELRNKIEEETGFFNFLIDKDRK